MINYATLKQLLFKLQPETAHHLAEFVLRLPNFCQIPFNSFLSSHFVADEILSQELFGRTFYNPIGLGAGFDKNATMIKGIQTLGFGYTEIGTLTPKPQDGNPKPRLFRYPEQESIQNAMGFNNKGMEAVKQKVEKLYPFVTPLAANIGKNKTTSAEDAISDYEQLIDNFKNISDFIVINISSPNTPGLRDLQNEKFIKELFTMAKQKTNKPVLLKIAPDLEIKDAIDICSVALDNGASGIVATNTTIDYSLLPNAQSFGGISGKVLEEKSTAFFEELAKEFYGKTTLISVGGIDSAEIAYKRIKAGANLVQIYSSFIFKGPKLNYDISKGILDLMDKEGFAHISEAIGADRK